MTEKKRWFIAYNYKMWVPVSWEGWAILAGQVLVILFILWVNDVFSKGDRPFSLSDGLPMIIEILVVMAVSLWVTRGHVDKRY